MMQRTNFESSGYKQMKIKEFDPVMTRSPSDRARLRARRQSSPGIGTAVLGAFCVVGVFALLGLLYSFG
jgi:hypothetical protein